MSENIDVSLDGDGVMSTGSVPCLDQVKHICPRIISTCSSRHFLLSFLCAIESTKVSFLITSNQLRTIKRK